MHRHQASKNALPMVPARKFVMHTAVPGLERDLVSTNIIRVSRFVFINWLSMSTVMNLRAAVAVDGFNTFLFHRSITFFFGQLLQYRATT